MALHQKVPLKTAVDRWCDSLSDVKLVKDICSGALQLVVPFIDADFRAGVSPDSTCKGTLGMCSEFPQCTLFQQWPPANLKGQRPVSPPARKAARGKWLTTVGAKAGRLLADLITSRGGGEGFYDGVEKLFGISREAMAARQHLGAGPHTPIVDFDQDRYGTSDTLRGAHWRGRDCDDLNPNVYPGRRVDTVGPQRDHNCNGIYGTDPEGNSYEEMLCAKTGQRGVIVLGDSAAAHFHAPPDWFTASRITNGTYRNLLPTIEDELDFPQCGAYVGHYDNSKCPASALPISSIYMKMRERNLCNHRDYVNQGVNGARTSSMKPPGIITGIKSRREHDHPATVFYALIGNDVCNGRHNFDSMTKPAEFEANVVASLEYLDEHLAPGSHVVFLGLVDGRVLWDTMHNLTHPVGAKYADVYDFLNCLQISPCWGWMNKNETVRELTTQRAMQLNDMYPKIVRERKYKNFEMFYAYADMQKYMDEWVGQGGKASDLIEPMDGFHPSTTANALVAKHLYEILEKELPAALGPVNPHNPQIRKIFGDQGGH